MRTLILPLIIITALASSCSSAYKSGQTPDDLYYSPETGAYVKQTEDKDKWESPEDRYVKYKVRNRRWRTLDDYDYWNDSRYNYQCHCVCGPVYTSYAYNPYHYWAGFYPYVKYYPSYYYTNPSKSPITAYSNPKYYNNNNQYNPKFGGSSNNNNAGSLFRRVFTSPNSGNTGGSTRTTNAIRTFENSGSSTPSSNAGGRSGGFNSSGSSRKTSRD